MSPYTLPAHAHQLYLHQLALHLRDSRLINAQRAAYPAPSTGQPDDITSSRRQTQRDSALLSAVATVYCHADTLVEAAQQQLARLPDSERMRHYPTASKTARHGQAVLDINAAVQQQPGPQAEQRIATHEEQLRAAPATPPPAPRAESPARRAL